MSVHVDPSPRLLASASSLEPPRSSSSSPTLLSGQQSLSIHLNMDAIDASTRPNQDSRAPQASAQATSEVVVLTPARLRVDSQVVFAEATILWPSHCLFCLLLWLKMDQTITWSWWAVFAPTWVSHVLLLPLQVAVTLAANHLIDKQLGPPPPVTATAGLHLQYQILRRTRIKSHLVDSINALLESTAMALVKLLLCWCLETNTWIQFRILFSPFWVAWFASLILSCVKDRNERLIGSLRDLQFIFFLFVSFKLDGQSGYAWRVVFLVPWMFYSTVFLLSCMVFVLLLCAKVWSRLLELLLPVGFLLLLLSTVPQFMSYIALVQRLDSRVYPWGSSESWQPIFLPNMLSWALMWASSGVLALGLRQKEKVREALVASGRVWTAHEDVARRFHEDREAAQRQVDNLSEEEIARMVHEMMAGRTKPQQMLRVGSTLYKRMTSFDSTAMGKAGGLVPEGSAAEDMIKAGFDADEAAAGEVELATSVSRAASGGSSSVVPPVDAAAPAPPSQHSSLTGVLEHSVAARPVLDENDTGGGQVVIEVAACTSSASTSWQPAYPSPSTPPVQLGARQSSNNSTGEDLCVICYDNQPTCVLLECGHGGFCRKCAYMMFVRPPNECPTCRQRIEQVLEVEAGCVGQPAKVKL